MIKDISTSLDFYLKSSNYLNTITLLQVDDFGFLIKDSLLNKILALNWVSILKNMSLSSWYEENYEKIKNLDNETYLLWDDLLNELEREDFEESNKNLKVLFRKGLIIDDYAEFFLWHEPFNWNYNDVELKNIMIDNVGITINNYPSSLFTLLHKNIENDDTFASWNMVTLSLNGITETNVENYIQRAIFLLGFFNPSYYKHEWPYIEMYFGEDYGYSDEEILFDSLEMELVSNHFTHINFPDAIAFYNRGVRIPDEIGVIYFYKVIEHFYLLPRKQQFQKLIEDNKDDIDALFEGFSKTYKKYNLNEQDNLKYLVDFLKDDLNNLFDEAFNHGLIDAKTPNKFASDYTAIETA